jgi:Cu/Ag efflux protein CusF
MRGQATTCRFTTHHTAHANGVPITRRMTMYKALSIGLLAIVTASANAQTATAIAGKGPGVAAAAHVTQVTATITAIDKATRDVTLKGPQGNAIVVQAGPEVKNFAQMHVGDKVDVEYTEALTLELKKGSTAAVGRSDKGGTMTAKPGASPAAVAGRQVTITAEVMAIDADNHTVTLRGPKRTVVLPVQDPEQLKLIAKGDRVEATYTEAVAIAVRPAGAKP